MCQFIRILKSTFEDILFYGFKLLAHFFYSNFFGINNNWLRRVGVIEIIWIYVNLIIVFIVDGICRNVIRIGLRERVVGYIGI